MLRLILGYGLFLGLSFGCDEVIFFAKSMNITPLKSRRLILSILDNSAHGFIAFYAWILVADLEITKKNILLALCCGLFACILDIDHFLAAGSWKLKDALSLHSRPPLHCSTILLPHILFITAGSIFNTTIFKHQYVTNLMLLTFVAIATHHLRDANRRGLWFCPFGSTKPIPRPLYLLCITIFPLIMSRIRRLVSTVVNRTNEVIV